MKRVREYVDQLELPQEDWGKFISFIVPNPDLECS